MIHSRIVTLALVVALLAPVLHLAPRAATAQEADDAPTTNIYAGDCGGEIGEPAATLVQPSLSEGEAIGAPEARPVATSFSTVPLSLDALLAAEHVIAVVAEQETAACGAIGGLRTEAGAIVIELSEQGNSGLSGVAYLAPSSAGPGQTDISLFLAGLASAPPETPAEPTAAPTTEATVEPGDEAPTEVTVEITTAFDPDPVVIPAGGTVTWLNRDGIPHTVTADDGAVPDSGVLAPLSGSYSQTFTEPGIYPYHDEFILDMQGTVIVEPAAASPADATTETSQQGIGEATAEPTEEAAPATETYVSPNFGYALTYDPTVWEIVEGPTSEDGLDFIGLRSGFTTVDIGGTIGIADAQACVQFMTDDQTSQANVTAFAPLLDESSAPLAGGDTSDAFAVTRVTRVMDDGTDVDQAVYVRCVVLPSGDAVLIIAQFAAALFYDEAAEQREALLQGLTLP
jgi:plastocyanin